MGQKMKKWKEWFKNQCLTLRDTGKEAKKHLIEELEKEGKGQDQHNLMNVVQILSSILAVLAYCTISPVVAEYQGKKLEYNLATIAVGIMTVVLVREIICLWGYKTIIFLEGTGEWLKKKKALKGFWITVVVMTAVAGAAVISVFVFRYNRCETSYWASIVEEDGLPEGLVPLSKENREHCAGYWEIKKYKYRRRVVLTYMDSYQQMEVMKKHSTAYSMSLFQPSSKVIYEYKENKDRYSSLGEQAYNRVAEKGFPEVEKVSYYSSCEKLLLKLERNEYDNLKITAYSSEEMPQLLNSTLLRIPDKQTAENGILSQQLEVTYNERGLPEVCRLGSGVNNPCGINGERYTYDSNKRLTTLCYLDSDGKPVCNKKGIMMIAFQYDGNYLRSIHYFSDKEGTEKTEGFYDVCCERFDYDSYGNLIERKQLNRSGNCWYDVNGVCIYRYGYNEEKDTLKKEEFFNRAGEPVQCFSSRWVEFRKYESGGKQKIDILFEQSDAARKTEDVNKIAMKADMEEGQESGILQTAYVNAASGWKNQEDKSVVGSFDEKDGETESSYERNYAKICYQLNRDRSVESVSYMDENGGLVIREGGYAGIRYEYDRQKRTVMELYFEKKQQPCYVSGGYAGIGYRYDEIEYGRPNRIEYLDVKKRLTFNSELGYAYVDYKYADQDKKQRVIKSYYNQFDELMRLPEKGYTIEEHLYDESGLLIREAYFIEPEVSICRTDYGIAEIVREYSEDGNLICERYKDAEGHTANRYDTGYAAVYQKFIDGQLRERWYEGYQEQALSAIADKTTGVAIIKYFYDKGEKQEEQYFDAEQKSVLQKNIGCAVRKFEYNDEGKLAATRFYDTDGEPIISIKYHCAGLEYGYDTKGNRTDTYCVDGDGNLMVREDLGYAQEHSEYDALGNAQKTEYFDDKGERVNHAKRGYAYVESIYRNGNWEESRYYDTEGNLVCRKDDGYAYIKNMYDELGRLLGQYYYGVDEKKLVFYTENHCAGVEFQYDKKGNRIETVYIGTDGKPMNRGDLGYAQIHKKYDSMGHEKKVVYLDADGKRTVSREEGYASYEKEYDKKGNWIKERYYDAQGNLVLRKDTGYAIISNEYDAYGRRIFERYYGTDGKPVIDTEHHCAGRRFNHDIRGNQTDTWFLDLNEELMVCKELGYARVHSEYDDFGNGAKTEYFDADGKRSRHVERGYAICKSEYENGDWTEESYYDIDEKLVLRKDMGYAVIKNEYDAFGRLKNQYYYGKEEEPVIHRKNYCTGLELGYNREGNRTDTWFLGANKQPMVIEELGYAHIQSEYDVFGNIIKTNYLDTRGNLAIRKEGGYSFYESVYKDGNWMEERYYNAHGQLVKRNDTGYAIVKNEYNEYGQRKSQKYYASENLLIFSWKQHCAGYQYQYDIKGNQIDTCYIGINGKMMVNRALGYARVSSEYDDSGNEIKVEYFDANGERTVRNGNGYAICEKKYKKGKLTEERYYNAYEKPILRKDTGCAIVRNEYDKYGRRIMQLYYGVDGEPVISTERHCAGQKYAYDARGNQTDTWYLDFNGELMIRDDLGYAWVHSEYNALGNEIKVEYFDVDGERTVHTGRGYAICESHYENGILKEERYLDDSEKLVLWKGKGYAVKKYEYDDENGRESAQYYYGTDEMPVISTEYRCAGRRFAYDTRGNQKDIWFLGLNDKVMVREDLGYARESFEYDVLGNKIKTEYFDDKNRSVLWVEGGYAVCESVYKDGNLKEERYYDTEKNLVKRNDRGYAIVKNEYDPYGQQTEQKFYSTEDTSIISTEYHCAGFKNEYDEKGNQTDTRYLGVDGEPMVRRDLGYEWEHSEYDVFGNKVWVGYYIGKKLTIQNSGGYAFCRNDYKDGKLVKSSYFDADRKLVKRKDTGYAVIDKKYDTYNHLAYEFYYGVVGKPVIGTDNHCAGRKFGYNDKGKQTDTWFLGVNGELMIRRDLGYAHVHSEYDNFGNEIEVVYFDTEEHLTAQKKEGYVSYSREFNEKGELSAIRYKNKDGELIRRKDMGYAIIRYEYKNGQCIGEFYYGENEKPVISTEYHCAGRKFAYDARGNKKDIEYLDLEQNLMVREDLGYAREQSEFDAFGNKIRTMYFDANGNPVECEEGGYASCELEYENRNWVEGRYYNAQGILAERKDTGYAVVKNQYDEYGLKTAVLYYDLNENPVINSKEQCAGVQYQYDKKGNHIDTWYLGTDENPMERSDYGFAQIHLSRDAFGNEIETEYLSVEGKSAIWEAGQYSKCKNIYKDGLLVESQYYDAQDNLTIRKDTGYAIIKNQYDEYGQCIAESYYRTEDEPVIGADNCAGIKYKYDEKGNKIYTRYLGTDGEPLERTDYEIASILSHYDTYNNWTGETYLDSKSLPKIRKDLGYAAVHHIYENSRWVETRYLDEKGNLIMTDDVGYAVLKREYDENWQVNVETFYDEKEAPVNNKYGRARIEYTRDSTGKAIGWMNLSREELEREQKVVHIGSQ